MDNKITIIQLNKGNSDILGRTDQINNLISTYKPHIIVINEINSKPNDKVAQSQFPNYRLETDNLDILDGNSRTGLLIHTDIHYTRRRDLESQGTSTVWIKLAYPGRKPMSYFKDCTANLGG